MKKTYKKPIPYVMFLSELFNSLQDYYHKERKKFPIFVLSISDIEEIRKHVEYFSRNKIQFEELHDDIFSIYDGLYLEGDEVTLTRAPLIEDQYLDINPNWITMVKEGFIDYMFMNESSFNLTYLNKLDRRDYEKSLKYSN